MGFASLYLLGLIPLAIASLVYAYRRAARGSRLVIGSAIILRQIKSPPQAKKNFKPPPRFFFDLLLVVLLALAAAGIYLDREKNQVAVIIDNSFATFASSNSGQPSDGTTSGGMLKQIQSVADQYIDSLSSSSEIYLFVAGPTGRRLELEPQTRASARAAVRELAPSFSNSIVEAALARAMSDGRFDQIAVFSRRELDNGSAANEELLHTPSLRASGVQSTAQNIGIVGINQVYGGSNSSTVIVRVLASVAEPVEVPVELERYVPDVGQFSSLGRTKVSVNPGEVAQARIEVNLPKGAIVRAKLNLETSKKVNAILQDDTAWIVNAQALSTYYLVSDFSPQQLGLDSIEGVSWEPLAEGAVPKESGALILLHRRTANSNGSHPTVSIMPERDFSIGGEQISLRNPLIQSPQARPAQASTNQPLTTVSRWLTAHPVNQYINFALLDFAVVQPLAGPPWMSQALSTSGGALVLAGERGGIRHVVTGFELLPFTGRSNPSLSVLLMNILGWVGNQSQVRAGYSAVGEVEVAQQVIRAQDLNGKALGIVTGPQNEVGNQTTIRKAILVESPTVVLLRDSQNESDYKAVNFFSQQESALLQVAPYTVPQVIPISSATKIDPESQLVINLLLIALFLLLLQYIIMALLVRRRAA